MLLYNILNELVKALNMLFGYLPLPDGRVLPTYFGVNTDQLFTDGVAYVRLLSHIFPPLTYLLSALGIYITFRLILLGVKVFLGSRTPIHNS